MAKAVASGYYLSLVLCLFVLLICLGPSLQASELPGLDEGGKGEIWATESGRLKSHREAPGFLSLRYHPDISLGALVLTTSPSFFSSVD